MEIVGWCREPPLSCLAIWTQAIGCREPVQFQKEERESVRAKSADARTNVVVNLADNVSLNANELATTFSTVPLTHFSELIEDYA